MNFRAGFTLIELVVAILILGILAGVASPKLLNTSCAATEIGLKQTLTIVRDAIELYAAEHGGILPGADSNPSTFKSELDPYLRGEFPKCLVGPAPNKKVRMVMTFYVTLLIRKSSPSEYGLVAPTSCSKRNLLVRSEVPAPCWKLNVFRCGCVINRWTKLYVS